MKSCLIVRRVSREAASYELTADSAAEQAVDRDPIGGEQPGAVSITRRRFPRAVCRCGPPGPMEAISHSRLWWHASPGPTRASRRPSTPGVTVRPADLRGAAVEAELGPVADAADRGPHPDLARAQRAGRRVGQAGAQNVSATRHRSRKPCSNASSPWRSWAPGGHLGRRAADRALGMDNEDLRAGRVQRPGASAAARRGHRQPSGQATTR